MNRAGRKGGDPLVRTYVITGGRSAAARNHFDHISLITLSVSRLNRAALNHEQGQILDLLEERGTQSVAEIGAPLRLPVSVLKILLADLMDAGHITVGRAAAPVADRTLLEAVLAGLQNL